MHSSGGAPPVEGRAILLAIDLSAASTSAALWAMHEFYRKGDTFHLVHVSRILAPHIDIHHQYHASYDVPDTKPAIDERAFIEKLKEDIRERFTKPMDSYGMPHNLHLFLDTDNATAADVCTIVFKVATEVDAAIIVCAAHGKPQEGGHDPWGAYLGSVADYATNHSQRPVMVVRAYTPPVVLHMSRSHGVLSQSDVSAGPASPRGSAGGSATGSRHSLGGVPGATAM